MRNKPALTVVGVFLTIGMTAILSFARAEPEPRRLSDQELEVLLPGKTLKGRNRNGEWIWNLRSGGVGDQIWDNGSAHDMTWEAKGGELCVVFRDGRSAGQEKCRGIFDLGDGRYGMESRRGRIKPFDLY